MSVCPSVYPSAKFVCTKTWERIKINAGDFIFVWMVYTGNQISQNFDPIEQTLTKLKPKEIFNDFSISLDQINEIDPGLFYFIDMD